LGLYGNFYGLAGVDTGASTPTALYLYNFTGYTGNNGTFNVIHWIDDATVQVYNPGGASPDTGNADFAVSLHLGSPTIEESGILELTGTPAGAVPLCTQECGAFRCFVENLTPIYEVYFASPNSPYTNPSQPVAVSFDGTTVNFDIPLPVIPPPAYSVCSTNAYLGGTVYLSPETDSFAGTVVGTPSYPFTLYVQSPDGYFSGWITNATGQPATVTNGDYTLAQQLGAGQSALITSDNDFGIWRVDSITADNGRAARASRYLL
jgi:hypothetical protein